MTPGKPPQFTLSYVTKNRCAVRLGAVTKILDEFRTAVLLLRRTTIGHADAGQFSAGLKRRVAADYGHLSMSKRRSFAGRPSRTARYDRSYQEQNNDPRKVLRAFMGSAMPLPAWNR
ncbi:MAG: hypothetical protein CM15mP68_0370 [Pseudomonadota bacterium]|nr:MAG: hypothetical protein CM15mP68_0370 [Pseudomonadota bacterium]